MVDVDKNLGHEPYCQTFYMSPETGKPYPCNCSKTEQPRIGAPQSTFGGPPKPPGGYRNEGPARG